MKRIIALVLSLLTVLSVCAAGVSVSAKSGIPGSQGNEANAAKLYASVLSLDNYKEDAAVTSISASEDVSVVSVRNSTPSAVAEPSKPIFDFHVEISGSGLYSLTVDASSVDLSAEETGYVVIDTSTVLYPLSDVSKLSVRPVLQSGETGEECEYVSYNGTGYFKMKTPAFVKGLVITVLEEDFSWNVSEIFFCKNEYSAKYMIDNNVLPAEGTQKQLFIEDKGESMAMDIGATSNEDFYHDFSQSKWPNIAVDENDNLYVVASAGRGAGHGDTIGSVGMVTSNDGGNTWTTPRRIFCSLTGSFPYILYNGNGELIIPFLTFTPDILTANSFRSVLKGGDLPLDTNLCESFDEDGYAVGGIYGNLRDLVKYFIKNDPDHYIENTYFLHSYDYGKTWDAKRYEFTNPEDVTEGVREMAENYELSSCEGLPTIPIHDGIHGPCKIYDGSFVYMGKEFEHTFDPSHNEKFNGYVTYVSRDDCKTWDYLGKLTVPCTYSEGDFQEPDVCENRDGVLIAGFRSFVVFLAYSYDHGKTWTTPVQTEMEGNPSGFLTMPNGDIVHTTNWRYGNTKIYGYVSDDGGRTWSTLGIVRTVGGGDGYHDMGYPNSVYLSDGTVVTTYYDTNSNIKVSRWKYELIDRKANAWAKNSTGWFYFDENCEIAKSQWIADTTGLCYVDSYGYLVAGKSFKYNKKYYLADDNGHKVTKTGWQKAGGNWYYVLADGTLKTDCWMKDSKGWCYLLSNGVMAANRSVKDTKGYCLVDAGGYWCTKTGWQKAGSDWYYVLSGGYLKTNGWMKDSKGWCYLAEDGMMKTNTVLEDSKGLCAIDGSGYWVTAKGWKKINNDWYYVQSGGYLKTNGWMSDSTGKWCYLGNDGSMLKNMAVKDSKGWVFVDASGYWVTTPQDWYVLNSYKNGLPLGPYYIDQKGYLQPKEIK